MFYVYVLKSRKDNRLYVGYTHDLRRRLAEHNTGKVDSTRPRMPLKLIYYEAYQAKADARHREDMMKLGAKALGQLKSRIKNSIIEA